jgi:hypothetical protein
MVGNEVIDERSEGESSELIDPDSTNESKKQRFSARNGKMPDARLEIKSRVRPLLWRYHRGETCKVTIDTPQGLNSIRRA